MKESDLVETIRSLLGSDEMSERHVSRYSASGESSSPVDEFSGEWSDGFPVPAEPDGELRDVLIELNVTTHEYIRMALEHHGGRLRQQEITDLTGWSEPTVSQKLGEMEDAGHITRFRTGREKIVCLPNDSPIDATQESDDDDDMSAESESTSGTSTPAPMHQDEAQGEADGADEEHEGARGELDGIPGEQDGALPEQDSTPLEQPDPPGNRDVPSQ